MTTTETKTNTVKKSRPQNRKKCCDSDLRSRCLQAGAGKCSLSLAIFQNKTRHFLYENIFWQHIFFTQE